ncbi:MAG TPA: OstA-like protein [Sphingobacteriaceae bacterium]|nr:OstA-like protein [Sphingobacteriaceae bacterium]
MKKLVVASLFLLYTLHGLGQNIKQVTLISSTLLKGYDTQGFLRIINPVFSHEGSSLAADSANFNQSQNTFDAFGNVVITQSNGTSVYSNLLNYNGNSRVALLTGNVRLIDGSATLTTDFLTYNMGTRIGTYTGGGKIVSGNDVLTSKNGYYFANTNDAYFRHNVIVNTPDALIKTDTLRYNSVTKTAFFYGPTNIFGKKDSTKLYTENGNYNTLTEQARFGKKNLYKQNTKSLKGDSLFYDGKAGIGRAINKVTFIDTEQKAILKGDLGLYREIDESALVTKNAYVTLTTEDKGKVDSIYMAADTLYTRLLPMKDFAAISYPQFGKDIIEQPVAKSKTVNDSLSTPSSGIKEKNQGKKGSAIAKDTDPGNLKAKADTLLNKNVVEPRPGVQDSIKARNQMSVKDTIEKSSVTDSVKAKNSKNRNAKKPPSVKPPGKLDIAKDTAIVDTGKTRIILAYRNVKIFKSDLQARSDSAFYSYADSTLRCYVNPIIWSGGSQLTADTIYLKLKNGEVDNILLRNKGFIVNTEADSARFNQIKGKMITGVFKDSKMNRLFVDGNAESIYYTRENSSYSGMNHLIASRMKLSFEDNKIRGIVPIGKPEGHYYPMEKIPQDKDILDGFIWKPKDRPRSKEEIIPSSLKPKSKPASKPIVKPAVPGKIPARKTVNNSSKKLPVP